MIVKYHMLQNQKVWDATMHQLNSDTLLRHIQMKGGVADTNLNVRYCEETQKGEISDSNHAIIGNFQVFF
ncbi:hypothetical protein NF212_11140 [Parasalinivibrio latis]|uniref:hypothetical protein n=1 Tax=Parasalinivibrio latis TaxID=2952610 RepID=UPI0030E21227